MLIVLPAKHLVARVSIAALLLAGCSGTKRIAIVVDGSDDMNTTSGGPGNAAEVRVYQLNNRVNFDNAGPRGFWQDDVGTLGPELIGSPVQISVFPSRKTDELKIVVARETRFIGIAANLRAPQGNAWKSVYTVDEIDDDVARFLVGQGSLILESEIDRDADPVIDLPTIRN